MSVLKKIIFILLGLIALLFITSLFLPKTFESKETVIIERPVDQVFEYVRHVKNQDNFGVWQLQDPNLTRHYEGNDGEVGFVYKWESQKLGDGSQKITEIVPNKAVHFELFLGFGEPAHAFFYTNPVDSNHTSVTWGIEGKISPPFNLMSLVYDNSKDFKEGLANLKNVLEKQ